MIVYTSITDSKDDLIDTQVKGSAEFIAYLDHPYSSDTWNIRRACDLFADNRRNSRIQKIMPHQYFDTEYSIYIDGNMQLNVAPEVLVEKYLKDHDIAVYKHPQRDCLYDEATVCAVRHLDDPEVIIEQVKKYESEGFARHKGLCECGVIIRRHTPKVQRFNEIWWSEYTRHSRRDQISFPYALDKAGLRVNIIEDYFIEESPYEGS